MQKGPRGRDDVCAAIASRVSFPCEVSRVKVVFTRRGFPCMGFEVRIGGFFNTFMLARI